jgi:hypothetical protein
MKKLLTIGLAASLLAGCQNMQSGKLDTDNLEKAEMADVDEEQAEKIPVTYKAPTVEEGLDALPFEMELPKKLPFEGEGFQPPSIMDMEHNGKHVRAEFSAYPDQDEDKKNILLIMADYPVESFEQPGAETAELKGGVKGRYGGKSIAFLQDKVQYTITYMDETLSEDQRKKVLSELADEMLK